MSDFLPEGYEAPKSNANYLRLEDGENKFRIMSKPIIGWLDWKDKKPYRFPMDSKPSAPFDPKQKVKHFWAFIVWDYSSSSIKILEITQATIQGAITNLTKDADWGSPFSYDIKIVKTGSSLETQYSVNPVPHKKLPEEIKQAFKDKPCSLEALYAGEDPFAVTSETIIDDLPF